jgi:prolyl-tRNA synthetase
MADAQTIEKLTGAAVGFAGPVGLKDLTIIADTAIQSMTNAATGANKTDYHLLGVNISRDFSPSTIADIRLAQSGDRCPKCGKELQFGKGIEIGHVFQLGTKYSKTLGAEVLDENGKIQPLIMGCYGIGLNRIIAAAIETRSDENGIIWPMNIAPFQVILVQLGKSDKVQATAQKLYDDLTAGGCEVLWDDRPARPGVKFKDADLIGIPLRITIGEKALANGNIELKARTEKEAQLFKPSAAIDAVVKITSQS